MGLAGFILVASGLWVMAAPADALPGSNLLGHRCRLYDPAVTNEDTRAALIDTSAVAGTWCETDAWTLADGTVIIWHDLTWGRVADHATLPAGVKPTSHVPDATWAQVRQIRTKGGQPVTRLGAMIHASATYHVPLVVEIRNRIASPDTWVTRADNDGATVKYYKQANPDCTNKALDRMRDAGAEIGLKLGSFTPCPMTSDQMQAEGASFVTVSADRVTPAYSDDLRAHGIEIYAGRATRTTARTVLANGAVRLLVDHPRDAATW